MKTSAFVVGVLGGADRSPSASLLRALLTPLAWLHRLGLEIYLLPYTLGLRRRCRLPVPVIAIGNLSSGGTGKTPMAALVARQLAHSGQRVVLLSRGYGGQATGPRIVSDDVQILLGPSEAGDEPTLLARLLPGIPVIVGKDRRQSGRVAVERFHPDVIVLDDALQFWQLHRDLDIVLLDARRPFDNGWLLPRGLLREPPSHLRRAGIVVLTRADRVDLATLAATKAQVNRLSPQAAVFTATHAPIAWVRAGEETTLPREALAERDVAAFSGIADCGAFVASVEGLGARVIDLHDFGDHHVYTSDDLEAISRVHADAAVTTEKDMVKVAGLWPTADALPLYALRIGMKIDDLPGFLERIQRVLRE